MKDLKKEKFIVKCELGFVNAEWINGKKYPKYWEFSRYEAQTYSRKRAEILKHLCENKNHTTFLISVKFENDKKKADNNANIYFDAYVKLKKEIEYYYNLCKKNNSLLK